MRQAFWDRRDDAPTTYERPYLQLPNPMHYRPDPRSEQRDEEHAQDDDEESRVIIIEM